MCVCVCVYICVCMHVCVCKTHYPTVQHTSVPGSGVAGGAAGRVGVGVVEREWRCGTGLGLGEDGVELSDPPVLVPVGHRRRRAELGKPSNPPVFFHVGYGRRQGGELNSGSTQVSEPSDPPVFFPVGCGRKLSLYTILFHFKALLRESIIPLCTPHLQRLP